MTSRQSDERMAKAKQKEAVDRLRRREAVRAQEAVDRLRRREAVHAQELREVRKEIDNLIGR